MTTEQITEMMTTFNQFKAVNDELLVQVKKTGSENSELKTKLEKINGDLERVEGLARAQEAKAAAEAQRAEKLEKAIEDLSAQLMRKGVPARDAKAAAEADILLRKAATFKALKWNPTATNQTLEQYVGAEGFKALTLNNDTGGGYLSPPEYVMEIITDSVEYSPIRTVARSRNTTRPELQIPKRVGTASATWTAETGTRAETTNPSFGMETIRTHEMYAMTKVSAQELEDSAFDLEAFLRAEFAEQFGVAEGLAFVSGNGVGKPEGVLTHTGVTYVVSGHATQITADGLIALYYEPKEVYINSGTFLLNRSTLKTIRQLKDGQGNYLWSPGIKTDAKPATILDRPYLVCPDMPSIGAGTYPVAFGDYRRGLLVVDRITMQMMTDPFTSKSTGMVEFSARKRVGGQVILAESIKTLKISA